MNATIETTRECSVYLKTSNRQTKQLVKEQTVMSTRESACQAEFAATKVVLQPPRAKHILFHQAKNKQCPDQPNIAVIIRSV